MEISREHAEALIHSGPCARAREAQGILFSSLPSMGVCPYCDLVQLLKLPDNELNTERTITVKFDSPKWWQFKKKRKENKLARAFEESINASKGPVPIK